MAKRKRHRRRGVGSVIQVRKLSGLGHIGASSSGVGVALPIVLGGGTALLTTVGIRQFMTPTTSTGMSVMKNAPAIGLGAGAIVAAGLWNITSQPAGLGALASAVLVSGGLWLSEYAATLRLQTTASGTAGMGAVIATPTSGNGANGIRGAGQGAIVLEPMAGRGTSGVGSYGETVNLGAINRSPFGTPGFQSGN